MRPPEPVLGRSKNGEAEPSTPPYQWLFQMLIHPFDTPDFSSPESFIQACLAFGDMVAVENGVMQVVEDGAAVDEFAESPEVVKAGTDVGILTETPALKLLVPTIDLEQVLFPHGHVATDDAALAGVALEDGERETKPLGSATHFP